MAVNKVVYGATTIIDLTGDTVTAADVAEGVIFHLPNGEQAVGTATPQSMAFTQLWTNPSPTGNFAAQTISLDLSAYTWIAITIIDNSNNDGDNTSLCKVGRPTILEASNFGSTQYKYMRKATVSTSGVTFTTGYRNTTGTTGAGYAIPQAIYGVC